MATRKTALDTETLEVLSESGYVGVICAPEQLILADGRNCNNAIVQINLPNKRSIIGFAFDSEVSRELGFNRKDNADYFTRSIIVPKYSFHNIVNAWTDIETFGLHSEGARHFINWLLTNSLTNNGIEPISINDVDIPKEIPKAKLVERSSWSCRCGDLKRWHTECSCRDGQDARWKQPFYQAFNNFNQAITDVVRRECGSGYRSAVIDRYETAFLNPGGHHSGIDLSLISAKVSALNTRASCGTFFGNPYTVSEICPLFAGQALIHLGDAGLKKDAKVILNNLLTDLKQMPDPVKQGSNGEDMFWYVFRNHTELFEF